MNMREAVKEEMYLERRVQDIMSFQSSSKLCLGWEIPSDVCTSSPRSSTVLISLDSEATEQALSLMADYKVRLEKKLSVIQKALAECIKEDE